MSYLVGDVGGGRCRVRLLAGGVEPEALGTAAQAPQTPDCAPDALA